MSFEYVGCGGYNLWDLVVYFEYVGCDGYNVWALLIMLSTYVSERLENNDRRMS